MPQTVWCDNKECIYHDDEYGVGECDVYRLDIKGGVCVGSSRNGRNVTSNDVVERLRAENEKLRELVRDLAALPAVPAFDCFGCKYEPHTDCAGGCTLVRRAKELGIEVDA